MNKISLAALAIAFSATAAVAETTTDSTGITTSNDPAKVAAVERHAQDLQSRPQAANSSGTSDKSMAKRHKHAKAGKAKKAAQQ
jgi:hypothetical protein